MLSGITIWRACWPSWRPPRGESGGSWWTSWGTRSARPQLWWRGGRKVWGKWRNVELKLRKFGEISSNKHITVQSFQYFKHFLKYEFSRGILETTSHWKIQYQVGRKYEHNSKMSSFHFLEQSIRMSLVWLKVSFQGEFLSPQELFVKLSFPVLRSSGHLARGRWRLVSLVSQSSGKHFW